MARLRSARFSSEHRDIISVQMSTEEPLSSTITFSKTPESAETHRKVKSHLSSGVVLATFTSFSSLIMKDSYFLPCDLHRYILFWQRQVCFPKTVCEKQVQTLRTDTLWMFIQTSLFCCTAETQLTSDQVARCSSAPHTTNPCTNCTTTVTACVYLVLC